MRRAYTFLALSTAALSSGQTDPKVMDRIVDVGKNHNRVMHTLRTLTHIGPRLTTSPKLRQAQNWAVGEFRRYGLKNVHLEKWGDAPVGFQRGERQIGRMVYPFVSKFSYTTQCWMPGTNGLVRAEAALAPKTAAEVPALAATLKGKWVLMPTPVTMRGPVPEVEVLRKALGESGVAGLLYGTADERVHSSGNWREKTYDKRPTEIGIFLSKADFDRVWRNVYLGRKPVLEFDIENQWFKGPLNQYNVVAEIPGTERPDEVVIVGGHLDSWNSPGSQGACDNGTGSSVTLEAARILMTAKARPRRTIRFILWSGEEQGLLGSRAYVELHKNELDKISAVLNDDGGTNYQGGYTGIASMQPMMEAAFAPTVKAFPTLPMTYRVAAKMPEGGSSDHAPFNMQGVPGFFTMETGRANYGHVWHTQFDRYEEAIPEYLIQSSTNHAVVAFNLACAPTMLPRAPKPEPAKTAMHRSNEDAVGGDQNVDAHDHADEYWQDRLDRLPRWIKTVIAGIR